MDRGGVERCRATSRDPLQRFDKRPVVLLNCPSLTEKQHTWRFLKTPAIIRPPFASRHKMLAHLCFGEVTEWPIVLVSKTSVPARVPRVRIPPSPPLLMARP